MRAPSNIENTQYPFTSLAGDENVASPQTGSGYVGVSHKYISVVELTGAYFGVAPALSAMTQQLTLARGECSSFLEALFRERGFWRAMSEVSRTCPGLHAYATGPVQRSDLNNVCKLIFRMINNLGIAMKEAIPLKALYQRLA
ncbi:hypothetical protein BC936DRAFT_146049 [Jimgerdemannia flammicorona]|uniref:Uncharacterized protein n=1 Tax=Jimgerdemannia flammicorona TaxID=994334 RepID=A0A433DLM8_9FUNG|nr:hypothetical protein BC936DRAFT_146049 [Jimgerdemannia flammicorona]